jgi:hypothetical protein
MHTVIDKYSHLISKDDRAATTIQSLWRGYRVRRNYLDKPCYRKAMQYLDRCVNLTALPKAMTGLTPVYLPAALPVVFKALGEEKSKRRFFTMWKARNLCIKNGYTHLIIPSAHPYKQFNIEDKLPVTDVKQREQVALYEQHQESFSQAVQEFTGFLCQSILPDILTYSHPYPEPLIPLGRYDNLPLLLEGNQGKIALIDLGGYQLRSQKLSLAEAIDIVKTVLFIFPYHFEAIFKIAQAFCPELIEKRPELEAIHCLVRDHFKNIYYNHYLFIQQTRQISENILTLNQKQILVLQDLETKGSQEDQCKNYQSLYGKILDQFKKKIISPIFDTLKTNYLHVDFITDVFSRTMTLPYDELFDFSHEQQEKKIVQSLSNLIWKALVDREVICYSQDYTNRSQIRLIKIHF